MHLFVTIVICFHTILTNKIVAVVVESGICFCRNIETESRNTMVLCCSMCNLTELFLGIAARAVQDSA